eukprot:126355-Chlamydomonas_euryale.AAC.10
MHALRWRRKLHSARLPAPHCTRPVQHESCLPSQTAFYEHCGEHLRAALPQATTHQRTAGSALRAPACRRQPRHRRSLVRPRDVPSVALLAAATATSGCLQTGWGWPLERPVGGAAFATGWQTESAPPHRCCWHRRSTRQQSAASARQPHGLHVAETTAGR